MNNKMQSYVPESLVEVMLSYMEGADVIKYINLYSGNYIGRLKIIDYNIRDDDLKDIPSNVEYLDFSNSNNITDIGLNYLESLTNLTHLDLNLCENISPNGSDSLYHFTKM